MSDTRSSDKTATPSTICRVSSSYLCIHFLFILFLCLWCFMPQFYQSENVADWLEEPKTIYLFVYLMDPH